jgi:hypothetical protein
MNSAISLSSCAFLVDVELRHAEATGVVSGDLLEWLGHHLAWTAPLGPEIDEHSMIPVDQVSEVLVGSGDSVVSHRGGLLAPPPSGMVVF